MFRGNLYLMRVRVEVQTRTIGPMAIRRRTTGIHDIRPRPLISQDFRVKGFLWLIRQGRPSRPLAVNRGRTYRSTSSTKGTLRLRHVYVIRFSGNSFDVLRFREVRQDHFPKGNVTILGIQASNSVEFRHLVRAIYRTVSTFRKFQDARGSTF